VLTLPGMLQRAVSEFPEREAVVSLDSRITFADLDGGSRELARFLIDNGVGKGTRVGGQLSYGADWITTMLAVTRVGGVFVPFSTAYKPAELQKSARHADIAVLLSPRSLFGDDRTAFLDDALPGWRATTGALHLEAAPFLRTVRFFDEAHAGSERCSDALLDAMAAEVSPADHALSIYTSGTTAEPKGVVHTHGALARKATAQMSKGRAGPDDRVFCGMPFFWVGGLVQGVLRSLESGCMLLCLEKPDAEPALDLMERERATHMIGWPGVTGPILNHASREGRDIPAFAVPPARRAGLGMTETLAGYTGSAGMTGPPDGEHGAWMGKLIEGMELQVVDPDTAETVPDGASGAILVRGDFLMAGLHKHEREETFTADGWYDTGDKGHLDDGHLFFEGRYKEMIKTSGNNVAPPEVELVLQSFPEVAEAHVLGVPDAQRGELVAAAVVPAPGAVIDPDALREQVRKELSNYKVPRTIVVIAAADLPTLANGKPDRLAIRELLARG
jgi:acyl-CoA synthetase (AMP-forming)/AMP-acid ligase II